MQDWIHTSTQVENLGREAQIFAKTPRGPGGFQGFQTKLSGGWSPILGFMIFIKKFFLKCFILPFPMYASMTK